MSDETQPIEPQETPSVADGDLVTAPGISPFAEYRVVPRLGIIHLMAGPAAMAVLLKYWIALDAFENDYPDSISRLNQIIQMAFAVCGGATIAAGIVGTSVLLVGTVQRRRGRLHPGHRLTYAITITGLLGQAAWAVFFLLQTEDDYQNSAFRWCIFACGAWRNGWVAPCNSMTSMTPPSTLRFTTFVNVSENAFALAQKP